MKKTLILLISLIFIFSQISEAKTTRVNLKIGKAVIKEKSFATDYLKITCNNGLVIEVDWESSTNESGFGYDLIDVQVSEDYNKMTIFMTVRNIIVNYLNGEYN
jgi:hypothetical protein